MILFLFLITQIILTLFILLHDWIDLPPFTDLKALRKEHSMRLLIISTIINTGTVLCGLLMTILKYPGPYPLWIKVSWIIIYTLLTIGTITAWWIPYFFGSSARYKAGFAEYKNTHTFLPARGNNVVPNTLHIILHVQVWFCCAVSWYMLFIN